MTQINKEAAFPHYDSGEGQYEPQFAPGLTKREYFAAMALQGLIAARGVDGHLNGVNDETINAGFAVEYADALLAALQSVK